MKKKIIIGIFSSLILITLVLSWILAIVSWRADVQNGIDLFEGFGTIVALFFGGFTALYELDLFYTVYYFFVKPRTKVKSVLNILSNGCFLLTFFSGYLGRLLYRYASEIFREDYLLIIGVFATYLVLRTAYFLVAVLADEPRAEEG